MIRFSLFFECKAIRSKVDLDVCTYGIATTNLKFLSCLMSNPTMLCLVFNMENFLTLLSKLEDNDLETRYLVGVTRLVVLLTSHFHLSLHLVT